jgi:gliding motility-associated-like protein
MNWLKYTLIVLVLIATNQVAAQTDIPDPPVFVSASIIPESYPTTVVLNWNPSDSLDVEGYIIYQVINGITETIDTVYSRLTTSFQYNMISEISKPEKFRLASFDSLAYKSSITDPHTTMFLNIEFDKCNSEVNLNWSEYAGWGNGVNSCKIYRRSEFTAYEVIESLSSDENSYTDDNLDLSEKYYYYVEAISNSGSKATSNSVEVLTNSFSVPDYMYAQYASVAIEDIVVNFIVDNSAEVLEYRIQRSASPVSEFSTIKTYANTGQEEIMYTDNEVNVNENRYYYRLASVNPCGIISSYSNVASNILLNAETGDDMLHDISWTDYYAWPNGVSNYKVYRYFNGASSEIAVNTPGSLDYSYNIDWYVDYCHDRKIYMTNEFCYYVEAYESDSPDYADSQGISRSNVSCVYHYPVVWLPTAFNAASYEPENRVFKPVLSFAQEDSYEFVIFDKWGEEIFKTNEAYEGWNGTINHTSLAPSQYYTYLVRFYDHQGREYVKIGTFFMFID